MTESRVVIAHKFKSGPGGLCEVCQRSGADALHQPYSDPTLNEDAERKIAHNVDTSPRPQRDATTY